MSSYAKELKIGILNLMPLKKDAEWSFINVLSQHPSLSVKIIWLKLETYVSKNIDTQKHLIDYKFILPSIENSEITALIITGAPLEFLDFKEVKYWSELEKIFKLVTEKNIDLLTICWATQAALYYFYGIEKKLLNKKASGIYLHKVFNHILTKGLPTSIHLPISRYAFSCENKIKSHKNLRTLITENNLGSMLLVDETNRRTFITGHPEYSVNTLQKEYERDIQKKLKIDPPYNYNLLNPKYRWRKNSIIIFNNWLNFINK